MAVAAVAATGVAAAPTYPLVVTVVQERAPAEVLGRAMSILSAATLTAIPFGIVLAGLVIEAFGLTAALVGMAGCFLVVSLSLLLNPVLREMDADKEG